MNNIINFIYNVENNFIRLVQYYCGSPNDYFNLILICKKFTKKKNHYFIAKLCIILKIIYQFINLILIESSLKIILNKSLIYLLLGFPTYLKFKILNYL